MPCMAVNRHALLIDPYGNLFGCTEESLVPAYEENGINVRSCGHISNPSLQSVAGIPGRRYMEFPDEIKEKKWPCYNCIALPVCGGKCPKEWREGRAACPSFKYNLPMRMLLYHAKLCTEKMG